MEPKAFRNRLPQQVGQGETVPNNCTSEAAPRHSRGEGHTQDGHSPEGHSPEGHTQDGHSQDGREDSGSRWRLWDRLKTAISSEHPAVPAPSKETACSANGHSLDHTRARQLLVAQRGARLPAADANALSAHLLTCDSCYRFAQDLAARSRQP